jgi:MoaA/NifB/PqqE/SkfB family radical SAM enzyme
MLKQLLIETVSACNLHCSMCAHREHMTGQSLERNKIAELLCDAVKYNAKTKSVPFTGIRLDGNTEPLIYKDFMWLMRECKDAAVLLGTSRTEIITNGVLLDQSKARSLLKNSISAIRISATGLTTDIYREFQGTKLSEKACEKTLNAVKNNVLALIDLKRQMNAKIVIELRYIMSEASVNGFLPYLDYWREHGADQVYVAGLGNGKLKTNLEPLGRITTYKACQRFGLINVRASGDVLFAACDFDLEPIGNIYDKSFFDIMMSNEFLRYEKAHKELDIYDLPNICIKCPEMHVYDLNNTENKDDVERNIAPAIMEYKNMFLDAVHKNKLIIWGAGAEFEKARSAYLLGCDIAYIVDNNPNFWNKSLYGLDIQSPEILKLENSENIVVLIASRHFLSIQDQLSDLGIKHHYATPLFLDRYIKHDYYSADQMIIPL